MTNLTELALWLAAPLLALLFLLFWLGIVMRRDNRLSLRIRLLGLTLDVKSDPST